MKTNIQNAQLTQSGKGAQIALIIFFLTLVGSVTANIIIHGIPNF